MRRHDGIRFFRMCLPIVDSPDDGIDDCLRSRGVVGKALLIKPEAIENQVGKFLG